MELGLVVRPYLHVLIVSGGRLGAAIIIQLDMIDNAFRERLKQMMTAHEMENEFPQCMGWTTNGQLRSQKMTWALKSPRKWDLKQVRAICRFFNEKGLDGPVEVMALVQEFDLGRDGLTWAEGLKFEREVAISNGDY
ncbi:MAG: hypothetical protein ACRBFS_07945 [Aureispira sp.]